MFPGRAKRKMSNPSESRQQDSAAERLARMKAKLAAMSPEEKAAMLKKAQAMKVSWAPKNPIVEPEARATAVSSSYL